jgi:hypothetical protein
VGGPVPPWCLAAGVVRLCCRSGRVHDVNLPGSSAREQAGTGRHGLGRSRVRCYWVDCCGGNRCGSQLGLSILGMDMACIRGGSWCLDVAPVGAAQAARRLTELARGEAALCFAHAHSGTYGRVSCGNSGGCVALIGEGENSSCLRQEHRSRISVT